jgi:uncharacterized protein YybS (DUF2232 family)
MSGDDKVKRLTESALLMAVSIVLFLGAFIPLLGILVAPFCPVPLCILTSRYGMRHGAFIAFTTVLCLSLIFSVVVGAAFVPFVFTGFVLGYLGRYDGPPLRALVFGIVALQSLFLLSFYGYEAVASKSETILSVREIIDDRFDKTALAFHDVKLKFVELSQGKTPAKDDRMGNILAIAFSKEDCGDLNKLMGLLESRGSQPARQMQMFIQAVMYFPFAFFFVLASVGFSMTFFVASVLAERFKFRLPQLPAFARWQGSRIAAVGGLLSTGLTVMLYNGSQTGELWLYLLNFSFVFLLCFIALGTSMMVFYLERLGIGPVIRFFLVLLAFRYFAFWPLPVLPLGALLDSLFDIRKIHAPAGEVLQEVQ